MKTLFKKIFLLSTAALMLWSCEKEEIRATLKTGTQPNLALSTAATKLVLVKDNADKEVTVATWTTPDYGFNAGVTYTLLIDKKGNSFAKAITVDAALALRKSMTHSELNSICLSLGLDPNVAVDVDMAIRCSVQGVSDVLSNVVTVNVTPYSTKIDLSSPWGVVGSAAPNGWNGPDVPFFKTTVSNVFKAYVTLIDGEIKFRQNNQWTVNFGDDGANGSLEAGGANIVVKAGTYAITIDMTKNTYIIEKLSWGLVGSATVNGWNGPDMSMVYNPYTDTWNIIADLADGEMKFRLNNDWGVNYGDDGANGSIEAGGANIAVKKGLYKIELNLTKKTYTIVATKLWGIVGSATPNGWGNGPDTKFTYDFIGDVWILNNMKLIDGEIKFRLGDDWGVNYGSEVVGKLSNGGANIVVKVGTYDFVLNFQDAKNPLFSMTKK